MAQPNGAPPYSTDTKHPGRGTSGPDQGWSWVVLAASALGLMLVSTVYSNGIFNITFLEEFQMNRQATAWITTLPGALLSLAGPVSSIMTNRLGPRVTVIIGGLVGSTGYLLTVFANDFYHVFITFGLITGTGFGICYVPCIVTVGVHFEKYRNLAFGVVNTAVGVSTIVFPFVIELCLEAFSWRGAMFMLSGIYLHMCACGAIFRSMPKARHETVCRELRSSGTKGGLLGSNLALEASASIECGLNYSHKSGGASPSKHGVMERSLTPGSLTRQLNLDVTEEKTIGYSQDPSSTGVQHKTPVAQPPSSSSSSSSSATHQLLKDTNFHLLCMSLLMTNAGNFIPFVHFPAYAMEHGASVTDAATFISTMGVCGVVSRLLCGAVTNHNRIKVVPIYLSSCFFCSLLFYVSPIMLTSYQGQLAFSAGFGFFGHSCHALMAPLTVELFSIELLSTALGVECLTCGIGILIGPPLAGFVYDTSGSYSYGFFTAGCLYTAGLILMLAIPIGAKCRSAHAQNELKKVSQNNGCHNGFQPLSPPGKPCGIRPGDPLPAIVFT